MKRTKKEWLDLLNRWVSKAEAIALAKGDDPKNAVSASVYLGFGDYAHVSFDAYSIKYEKPGSGETDETEIRRVETELEEMAKGVSEALKARKVEMEEKLALLRNAIATVEDINVEE